ncbi:MAG: hypothetical protein AAF412_11475, partial [Pseudomonadota bacterium]
RVPMRPEGAHIMAHLVQTVRLITVALAQELVPAHVTPQSAEQTVAAMARMLQNDKGCLTPTLSTCSLAF